jgi:hypothetical protein
VDVFGVREQLVADYRAFTSSLVDIRDTRVRDYVQRLVDRGYQRARAPAEPEPGRDTTPGVDYRLGPRMRGWLLGWRDVACSVDERTLILSAIPRAAVGHKLLLMLGQAAGAPLQANLSSFVLDYVARLKMSGASMAYFIVKQLPVLPPGVHAIRPPWTSEVATLDEWVTARVLGLTYTSYDIEAYARDLGDQGARFRWDPQRRELLRAELDAAYFHLYGIERDDVDYVMDTFKVVRERDEKAYGEFRTKRLRAVYCALCRRRPREAAGERLRLSGQRPRHR